MNSPMGVLGGWFSGVANERIVSTKNGALSLTSSTVTTTIVVSESGGLPESDTEVCEVKKFNYNFFFF